MKAFVFLAFIVGIQQPTPAASVAGIVLDSVNQRPLAKATVELRQTGSADEPYTLTTSNDGKFAFVNLVPGQYQLIALRGGYTRAEFGQRTANGPSQTLSLTASQRLNDIKLVMTPTGTISGRVFDGRGQPFAGTDVQALRVSYVDGRRVLTGVKNARTNDLGEYRIFWLPPGQYYVVVNPVSTDAGGTGVLVINPEGTGPGASSAPYSMAPIPRSVTAKPLPDVLPAGQVRVPVYYPDTIDPDTALPVDVRAGSEVVALDIHAGAANTRRVRGTVTNSESRQPAAAQVRLVPARQVSLLNASVTNTAGTTVPASGEFDIEAVPGSYLLIATVNGGARGAPASPLTGAVAVEVRDQDIAQVSVFIKAGSMISGKVSSPNPVTGLSIELRIHPSRVGVNPVTANVAADGTFTLRNVADGEYRVYVRPILTAPAAATGVTVPTGVANTYVRSIRMGSEDLLNDVLRVNGQGDTPLLVELASPAATIDGRVVDETRTAQGGVFVVMLEDGLNRYRSDPKVTSTDPAGRFVLSGVSPGRYTVFAWRDVERNAWLNPDFMRQHEGLGKSVIIVESATQTLEVAVIP